MAAVAGAQDLLPDLLPYDFILFLFCLATGEWSASADGRAGDPLVQLGADAQYVVGILEAAEVDRVRRGFLRNTGRTTRCLRGGGVVA